MTVEDKKKLEAIVQSALNTILEHADSVQIIATKCHGGTTVCVCKGDGNWYARVHSCQEFIDSDSAKTLWFERPSDPPEPSDNWKRG